MKNSIRIAGAYVGLIVGAGFASGQEILQFFTSFGWAGTFGVALATALFAWLGMQITRWGCRLQAASHKEVIYFLCGRYLGRVVDWIVTFFLFGVTAVMIAGAGSIFAQQFGFPIVVGSSLIALLTLLTLLLDVQRIVTVIGSITPFLVGMALLIALYSWITADVAGESLAKPELSAASHWSLGALLYGSYNIAAGVAMLAVIGGTVRNVKTAERGGLLGGLGLGLLILLIHLGMLSQIDQVAAVDMPTLFLADRIAPWLAMLMAVILLGMIFNTAVGMLYAFSTRLVPPNHPHFKGYIILFTVAAIVASFVGFTRLVGTVYPVMGYLGFILIGSLVLQWFRSRFTSAKEESIELSP